ncbi:phospholipid phosphatase 5-like isoform X2 [Chelonus insularis]|uniref:phospholipid phosphatase 5-like isoform X2 n=1 Tax=Chelonus insularis TaxID=460826 RepID=UPI00158A0488|nr:phospholipid phosphatase 5-like isoform X2 [Chelonus insularis]
MMAVVRGVDISINFWFDIFLRIFLAFLIVTLEKTEPFNRKIHDDELWLYKNPKTDSYVPTTVLWDKVDFAQAVLAVTLALGLNGLITNVIKIIVGRPRPDFFWRCFPDGLANVELNCTGNPNEIRDGKKSFPSGHSSFAFVSFGFTALYLAGKLKTFSLSGKGNSWTLCCFLLPLIGALCIAISRTCDYHHHWQDVVAGSLIGFLITYMCYRHYYPSLDSHVCYKSYITIVKHGELKSIQSLREDQIKWI